LTVDLRVGKASAVVVQRVPAAAADWFLEWQRGVTAAAEGFAGYRGTDVYPPADAQADAWVVVLHFEDEEALGRWLTSPARAEWVARLRARVGDFQLQRLPGGFGPWFAGLPRDAGQPPPPSWKMALTVLLGLYPTVLLLSLFPGKYTAPLGLAVSMLIGNALSVALLQWAVMPGLTTLLSPWLHARADRQRALTLAGAGLIVLVLAGVMALFRQVTG
jgi:antibiotic biosynthesis monooxygenase (ABM) superfamily enzyme